MYEVAASMKAELEAMTRRPAVLGEEVDTELAANSGRVQQINYLSRDRVLFETGWSVLK